MKGNLSILLTILFTNLCFGSCFGPKYNLTEVLANEEDRHHIFTCKVIATYYGPGGYNSMALVNRKYRGNPFDTVYIVTGGNTTMGGTMLMPNTEWLIISETKDRKHYSATICHNLSRRIDDKNIDCAHFTNEQGMKFMHIIEQYFSFVNSRYSGSAKLSTANEVFAESNFLEGKANGTWKHYTYSQALEKQIVVSEYHYKSGIVDGKIIKYRDDHEPKMKFYEGLIVNGWIQWENWGEKEKHIYTYMEDRIKIDQVIILGEQDDTLRIGHTKYLDFTNDQSLRLWFRDGYYFNMKDSSDIFPLCEGYYFKGAKVGLWKFFNKKGEVIRKEAFSFPDTTGSIARIYDEEGMVAFEGQFIDGHRVGKWRHFYKGVLENEVYYTLNSDLNLVVRHYRSKKRLFTPYKDGRIHGTQLQLDSNGQVQMLCEYNDGNKNGRYVAFDKNGNIRKESKYTYNRETTILDTSSNAPKVNGFSNGYNIQYSLRDGHKMYEGEIKMGYNVGKHINYRKDGSYSVTYNSEDMELLMYPCKIEYPIKREYYDKDGKLIDVDK